MRYEKLLKRNLDVYFHTLSLKYHLYIDSQRYQNILLSELIVSHRNFNYLGWSILSQTYIYLLLISRTWGVRFFLKSTNVEGGVLWWPAPCWLQLLIMCHCGWFNHLLISNRYSVKSISMVLGVIRLKLLQPVWFTKSEFHNYVVSF